MSATLIDGKKLSQDYQNQIAKEVLELRKNKAIVPGLAVVLVGNDEASKVYVRNKEAACQKVGFHTEQHSLSEKISEKELLQLIDKLNKNPKIHGILVQLPLPSHIDSQKVIEEILPEKDADGFHPMNMGNLLIGKPGIIPCTPLGVMKILESISYSLEGKEVVVVGRSNIVGKPVALLLMQKNATVTICHSRTKNLEEKIRAADVVVAAIGRAHFIQGDWIKSGAVVMDVGMNRLPNGKLAGDVDFERAKEKAAFITPVPGGVGPMTIAMLLWNTLQIAKRNPH